MPCFRRHIPLIRQLLLGCPLKILALLITAIVMPYAYPSLYAQSVVRLDHIDRISYQAGAGAVSFYEKKDTLYRRVMPGFGDVVKNGSTLSFKTGAWQTARELFRPGDSIVNVSDLESCSPAVLFRRLSRYQYEVTQADKGDTIYSILGLFNNSKVLIHELSYYKNQDNDSSVTRPEHNFYVKDFLLLQLRPDKCIVLYQNDEGFLMPTQRGLRIFLDDFAFHRLPVRQQKADASWHTQDDLLKQMVHNTRLHNNNYYTDKTDEGREILVDNFGIRLLPGAYDQIKRTPHFIIVTTNGKTTVYDIFLRRLIGDIRSYTLDQYFPGLVYLLRGNTLSVVDFRGQLNPKKKYLPDLSHETHYTMPCYHPPSSYTSRYFQVDKQEQALYLHSRFSDEENHYRTYTQLNRVLLPGNARPEDATLLHHNTGTPSAKEAQWLIVRQQDHYGLYAIKLPPPEVAGDTVEAHNRRKRNYTYSGSPLSCRELVPAVMDSIIRYDEQGYLKLLICRKGLKGIYPLQTEPVYSYLGKPDRNFARFERAGKKGWLNLQRQEEFMDH